MTTYQRILQASLAPADFSFAEKPIDNRFGTFASKRDLIQKYNPHHDTQGRFASGSSGVRSVSTDGPPTHEEAAKAHDAAAMANDNVVKNPDPGNRDNAIKATSRALAHTQLAHHNMGSLALEAANSTYSLVYRQGSPREMSEGAQHAANLHREIAKRHREAAAIPHTHVENT